MENNWGVLWCKENQKEKPEETLDNAMEFYKLKYGFYPEIIEVSNKDFPENFEKNGTKIIPRKYYQNGILWMLIKDKK